MDLLALLTDHDSHEVLWDYCLEHEIPLPAGSRQDMPALTFWMATSLSDRAANYGRPRFSYSGGSDMWSQLVYGRFWRRLLLAVKKRVRMVTLFGLLGAANLLGH